MSNEELLGQVLASQARVEKLVKQQSETIAALTIRVGELEERIGYLIGIASKAFDQAQVVNEKFRQLTRDENDDTDPQVPESIRAARKMISRHDGTDEDEEGDRPSLLTEQMNLSVGPARVRGPAIVIGSLVALLAVIVAALAFTHSLPAFKISRILNPQFVEVTKR